MRFGIMIVSLALLMAGPAFADAGQDVVLHGSKNGAPACSACHGETGAGQPQAGIPRLAGFDARYIVRQLESFSGSARANSVMQPIASALTPQEREAVAKYFSEQAPAKANDAVPDPKLVAAGAALAARGDWAKGVPACKSCHAPDALGTGGTVPRLAAQSSEYIVAQLRAWQGGTRHDDPLGLMTSIASKLDSNQIAAAAAYFSSLPVSGAKAGAPAADPVAAEAAMPASQGFAPPPESAIPNDDFGKMVKLGENIFADPQHFAGPFVGNTLSCSNCHIARGRLAGSAPLWAAYVAYPAYRSKNKHVNTFEERIQGCFKFSMNGKAPPLGSETLVALETYSYFLAKGAPTGVDLPGRGYGTLKKPAKPFDYARGQKIYETSCALCHGANGEGRNAADGRTVFPALWGPHSFNWGAGMGNIKNAAAFIKSNMPFGHGGTLSDQQAWDVAAFVDSHERPQDPRFTGTVEGTRAKYHDGATWMYGKTVNGVLLGEHSVPPGKR